MTLKEKLELTETRVYETRHNLRQIVKNLESIKRYKETNNLVESEELQAIDDIENLLYQIEQKIYFKSTFDLSE